MNISANTNAYAKMVRTPPSIGHGCHRNPAIYMPYASQKTSLPYATLKSCVTMVLSPKLKRLLTSIDTVEVSSST